MAKTHGRGLALQVQREYIQDKATADLRQKKARQAQTALLSRLLMLLLPERDAARHIVMPTNAIL